MLSANLRLACHALFVGILGFVQYIDSRELDLVFDDNLCIRNNDDAYPSRTTWQSVFFHDYWGRDLRKDDSHKSYRPLTMLTFRLNVWASDGLNAPSMHLTNAALHAVVCFLVTLLAFDLFAETAPSGECASASASEESVAANSGRAGGNPGRSESTGPPAEALSAHADVNSIGGSAEAIDGVCQACDGGGYPRHSPVTGHDRSTPNDGPQLQPPMRAGRAVAAGEAALMTATWAGMLFAVHPVHVEAVAGLVSRAELLCAICCIAAHFAYSRFAFGGGRGVSGAVRRLGIAALFCALFVCAVLTKETGLTILAVVGASEPWLRSGACLSARIEADMPCVFLSP